MRLGAWLSGGALLAAGACSGGYPLPPTPCDDLCDASQGTWSGTCWEYEPAQCVAQCESQGLYEEPCRPLFDALVTCHRSEPSANRGDCSSGFGSGETRPCHDELSSLLTCVSLRYQLGAAE